jgi:hypothetical protein
LSQIGRKISPQSNPPLHTVCPSKSNDFKRIEIRSDINRKPIENLVFKLGTISMSSDQSFPHLSRYIQFYCKLNSFIGESVFLVKRWFITASIYSI